MGNYFVCLHRTFAARDIENETNTKLVGSLWPFGFRNLAPFSDTTRPGDSETPSPYILGCLPSWYMIKKIGAIR